MRLRRFAMVLGVVILAVGSLACQGRPARSPEAIQPTRTQPSPAATSTILKAQTPTSAPTPASASALACPEDPRVWALVPLQGVMRDPKTGKPIQLPKPPQRIDPPCVYEGLARDLARTLVPNPDLPAPQASGRTLSAPWFWAPGMDVPTIQLIVDQGVGYFEASYDAGGKRIEKLYLPYTAVATRLRGEDPPVGSDSLSLSTSSPGLSRRAGGVGGGSGLALRAAPVAAGGAFVPLRPEGHLPGGGGSGGGEAHRDPDHPPGRRGGQEGEMKGGGG